MWSSRKGEVPHIPPSLNVDNSWEKQAGPKPSSPTISSARDKNEITPYLGLRARYSQIWLNRWTILLLLVLVHFLLTADSLRSGLDDSKAKALSACKKVEDTGSAMASMPHYLSRGVNSLTASGITNSVHALIAVLDMIITSVETLIKFFIHMMTDIYVCLITLAVHGALNVSAVVVEKTTDAMNKAIDGFADGLLKTTDKIQEGIDKGWEVIDSVADAGDKVADGAKDAGDKIVDGAGKVGDTIGGLIGRRDFEGRVAFDPMLDSPSPMMLRARDLPPEFAVAMVPRADLEKPDVKKPLDDFFNKIKDINIDSSGFVEDINALNDKIPTFDEVRNMTNEAIAIPFDLVRKELDKAYGNWSFDQKVFPVAQKEALSFCSDNSAISDFFETLFEIARKAKIVACVVLVILALLACLPMLYMEKLRWDRQVRQTEVFSQAQYDHLDVAYMYSRPKTARVGLHLSRTIQGWRLSRKKQILARWCVAYATSLPALFVLSLALAGFFSCLCQYVLLRAVEREVPALATQVGEFADDVVYSLGNVSKRWADDANGVIGGFNDDINNDVLGQVSKATTAVNDTLNTFNKYMDEGLQKALGNTAFKDAAAGVIRCVIGLKIESVQKGLTWIHDHAHVEFPRFPDDVYSLGANESISGDPEVSSFLAAPGGATADEVTDAVLHVTRWLRNSIIQAALIALALFLIYVLVVLMGVVWALARAVGNDNSSNSQFHNTPATSLREPPLSPKSPRRSRSMSETRSPGFHNVDLGLPPRPGVATVDDPFSDSHKMDVFGSSGSVPRGRGAVQEPGHARTRSSHGFLVGGN